MSSAGYVVPDRMSLLPATGYITTIGHCYHRTVWRFRVWERPKVRWA